MELASHPCSPSSNPFTLRKRHIISHSAQGSSSLPEFRSAPVSTSNMSTFDSLRGALGSMRQRHAPEQDVQLEQLQHAENARPQPQKEYLFCILRFQNCRIFHIDVTETPASDQAFFKLLSQKYWEQYSWARRMFSWALWVRVSNIQLVEFQKFEGETVACIKERFRHMRPHGTLRTTDEYAYSERVEVSVGNWDLAYLFRNPEKASQALNLFPYLPRKQENHIVNYIGYGIVLEDDLAYSRMLISIGLVGLTAFWVALSYASA